MSIFRASLIPSIHIPASRYTFKYSNPRLLNNQFNSESTGLSISRIHRNKSKTFKVSSTLSSSSSPFSESIDSEKLGFEDNDSQEEKFDWFSQWYPVMLVCDLDKRVPHAKKIMGLDVVVWWDRNEGAWKVFDDACPHRLAPLSEGRIDQWGRLQCVYHGWCFNGSGDCKFIPQSPPDGPPVHTFKKACAAIYPSTVHHDIVWFWPSTDPQYKDIIMKKKPPFIPELDDPSFAKLSSNRDMPYGYEVLIENLMDPAHVHYAHYGIMQAKQPIEKRDREGGWPMELSVKTLDVNGFIGKQDWGSSKFIAPCVFYSYVDPVADQGNNGTLPSAETNKGYAQKRLALIFICVPVSPGNSRMISFFPRNFATWIDKVVPRWIFHKGQNLVLDTDLYLLHVEERKLMDKGLDNWQKTCFVPTKSDAFVVGFRRWLKKYAGGQVDWKGKYNGALPPTPPREQLMDRYWSHVVNCSSCSAAYKGLNTLEVILQVISIVLIGIVAATKEGFMSAAARNATVATAVACFAASRWLAHFIYKYFHFHDYNHSSPATQAELLKIPW